MEQRIRLPQAVHREPALAAPLQVEGGLLPAPRPERAVMSRGQNPAHPPLVKRYSCS